MLTSKGTLSQSKNSEGKITDSEAQKKGGEKPGREKGNFFGENVIPNTEEEEERKKSIGEKPAHSQKSI